MILSGKLNFLVLFFRKYFLNKLISIATFKPQLNELEPVWFYWTCLIVVLLALAHNNEHWLRVGWSALMELKGGL